MTKGLLNRIRITNDTVLNFFEDTKGEGAAGISIYNDGQTTLIIDDGTNEEIAPGQYFFVENDIPIINTSFRIRFKKEVGKANNAIMSYIVPIKQAT